MNTVLANTTVRVTFYLPEAYREPGDSPWVTSIMKLKDISRYYTGKYERVTVNVNGKNESVFRISSPDDYVYFKFDDSDDEASFLEYSEMFDN